MRDTIYDHGEFDAIKVAVRGAEFECATAMNEPAPAADGRFAEGAKSCLPIGWCRARTGA